MLDLKRRKRQVLAALLGIVFLAGAAGVSAAPAVAGTHTDWTSGGFNIANTRSNPFESTISTKNANRLAVKWTFTTHGDVFPIHGATMKPFGRHRGDRSFPSEERSKGTPEWNHYRIVCTNGVLRLSVNGKEVSGGEDCNYRKGYLALESEGAPVEFRNIRIRELPRFPRNNLAPEGFKVLFDGVNLTGWKGLVETPPKRAKLSATELAAAQEKADQLAGQNWQVSDGALVYRGKGFDNLCTSKAYGDFGRGLMVSTFGSTSVSPYADEDAAYTTRRALPATAARST